MGDALLVRASRYFRIDFQFQFHKGELFVKTAVYSVAAKRDFAAQMRNKPTLAETALWWRLQKKQTGLVFHRQSLQRGYILDFYCPRLKLGIEVDGSIHDLLAEQDAKKEEALSDYGIKLLRFTNQDVLDFIPVVMARIETTLKALTCHVVNEGTPPSSSSSRAEIYANRTQPIAPTNPWAGLKAVLGVCRPSEIPDAQRLTRESAEEIVGACKKLLQFDRQRAMQFDNRTNDEKAFEQNYRLQEWLKKKAASVPPDDEAALVLQGMHVTEPRKA